MNTYQGVISKAEFVSELKKHQEADRFIKGSYWKDGKGCAVGCSLESISRIKNLNLNTAYNQHDRYPDLLGIPEWLADLKNQIFEGVSEDRSKTWPVEFAEAIPENVDLEQVKVPFITLVLEHTLISLDGCKYDEAKSPEVKAAIYQSKAAVKRMIAAQKSKDGEAIKAARSAAWSARSAAWSANSAAYWAALSAALSAADSAADSARSAAYSAAKSAYSAAYSAAFEYYANRLLELLRECK